MTTFLKALGLLHDADAGLCCACYDEHYAGTEHDDAIKDLQVDVMAHVKVEEGFADGKADEARRYRRS